MANTFTQLYIHYVFAVQDRLSLIHRKWQDDLYKYMNGIIIHQGHKLYVINGMTDHIHILISMSPKQAPSDLMYHLKRSSSMCPPDRTGRDKSKPFVNRQVFMAGSLPAVRQGFGAFSLGKSQLPEKIKYIKEQQHHHKKASFREEYLQLLKENDIEYDERYIFKPID